MKYKLSKKIFLYMMLFSTIIVVLIGLCTKFALPTYYLNQQLDYLVQVEEDIRYQYIEEDMDAIIYTMESARNELGGELYYYSETSGRQGYGLSKVKGLQNNNSENFVPGSEITVYTYKNKIDLDIYVIGVQIEDNFLVYEVSIQTLNHAVDTMMNFMVGLLVLVFLIALVISKILSGNISKPIRELNQLANSMKQKNIKPYLVTSDKNEIGQLNQTLNELYEELLGNIYQLKVELHKERNVERLKKRFLAQATHELKTPIAIIRGYTEILYDGMYKNEEERDQYIKNIYDESEAVSHLILDVLDYTKMETGNYKLAVSETNMHSYFIDLSERYADYIKNYKLQYFIEINISEDMKKEIDEKRCEQVYLNLLSNAVEHSLHEVRVTIDQIGSRIRLSVYNDGETISEEDMPNVFESFYKKRGKKTGSGLGLAIVKEIILLHGGEYRVNNHEKGVEFVVIL